MRTALAAGILACALPTSALAFCGTYAGGADTTLTNRASRIAVAHSGDTVTLTLANDVQGDLDTFGLVIPVPGTIGAADVAVVSPQILDDLDEYSTPRVVTKTCADFYGRPLPPPQATTSVGCGAGSNWSGERGVEDTGDIGEFDPDLGVTVESLFTVGEYEATVLAAENGAGLTAWLDLNGFTLPPGADLLLDEYISSESRFLALRVLLDEVPDGRDWLSPLQITYPSLDGSVVLPIRLGTLSSVGVQDLIIYGVTDQADGAMAIANYPQAAVANECMIRSEMPEFPDTYESHYRSAVGVGSDPETAGSGAAWVTEYAWTSGKCDPCSTPGGLDPGKAAELGYAASTSGFYFTRLHLRLTPDAVDQDVVLYSTGNTVPHQVRYYAYHPSLESTLPVCGEPESADPGTCFSAGYWEERAQAQANGEPVEAIDTEDALMTGCSSVAGHHALGLLVLPLIGWRRRRS